jgi:transposase
MVEKETNQKVIRKKYSPQFKDQALERAERDGAIQAANDLGIPVAMLYSWRAKQRQAGQPLEQQKLQQAEMARLKRENARLEEENSFLKKVATYFTKESKSGTP